MLMAMFHVKHSTHDQAPQYESASFVQTRLGTHTRRSNSLRSRRLGKGRVWVRVSRETVQCFSGFWSTYRSRRVTSEDTHLRGRRTRRDPVHAQFSNDASSGRPPSSKYVRCRRVCAPKWMTYQRVHVTKAAVQRLSDRRNRPFHVKHVDSFALVRR